MAKGKFIVIDGPEGAGKSTLMQTAQEVYGDKIILTREPGGSPFAESIRNQMFATEGGKQADAKTQFNLAWAARADHLKNVIKPAIDQGTNVISDRFDSSTWAYQIHAQDGSDLKELFELERKIIVGNYVPNLYLYLDVNLEEGLRRKHNQVEATLNHFDDKELAFHQKVKEGFLEFLKKVPYKLIDANQSLEKVKAEFLENLKIVFDEK